MKKEPNIKFVTKEAIAADIVQCYTPSAPPIIELVSPVVWKSMADPPPAPWLS